jgi:hypothetical protein
MNLAILKAREREVKEKLKANKKKGKRGKGRH